MNTDSTDIIDIEAIPSLDYEVGYHGSTELEETAAIIVAIIVGVGILAYSRSAQ